VNRASVTVNLSVQRRIVLLRNTFQVRVALPLNMGRVKASFRQQGTLLIRLWIVNIALRELKLLFKEKGMKKQLNRSILWCLRV